LVVLELLLELLLEPQPSRRAEIAIVAAGAAVHTRGLLDNTQLVLDVGCDRILSLY
jgi:hypothetical protein